MSSSSNNNSNNDNANKIEMKERIKQFAASLLSTDNLCRCDHSDTAPYDAIYLGPRDPVCTKPRCIERYLNEKDADKAKRAEEYLRDNPPSRFPNYNNGTLIKQVVSVSIPIIHIIPTIETVIPTIETVTPTIIATINDQIVQEEILEPTILIKLEPQEKQENFNSSSSNEQEENCNSRTNESSTNENNMTIDDNNMKIVD